MFCERCNIEFQEGLRFCKWCGNTLTERRRVTSELHGCPSCAAPIQSSWVFCKACGVKLNAAASGQAGEFCPRCGSKSDPDWLNCARCGEDLGRVKAPRHTALTSGPGTGRAALTHCSECGDKLEPGATYCKGCGAAIYAASSAFGASSLLCSSCNSYSPLGSTECRVCGAKFGQLSDTVDITTGKKSSTLPDLDEHLPGPDLQNSETVAIGPADGEIISGAHTLIIGPSGAIQQPPLAEESSAEEAPAGKAVVGERTAGGADTTVLPGVAGSKSELPAPTGLISETRITGPVDGDPAEAVDEERNPLSTQLDMPAIKLDELDAMMQEAGEPPAQAPPPAVTEADANSTIVMGSLSAFKESATKQEPEPPREEGTETLYRQSMTAPFGLEVPEDVADTQPEIPVQQAPGGTEAERVTAHQPAATAEFGGGEQTWTPAASVTKSIGQPVVAHQTDSERLDYPRVPSALPERTQKKGPVIASIIVAVLVLAVSAYVVFWLLSGGSTTEPDNPQATTPVAPTTPADAPPETPSKPPPPKPPEGMIYVPGGTYTVGRDSGDPISGPAHPVTLSPFFIDRTEVTNAEYKKFIDATGREAPSDWKNGSYPEGRDNWPVTNIKWLDAAAYADWIGKRLPTEAEWEAAARGTDGRLYPWGNQWQRGLANAEKKAGKDETDGIVEVGQYENGASPFGALDMIGNVWEFTADQFELYPGSTAKTPAKKLPGITYYVIRGGSFDVDKSIDATRRGFLEENIGYPKTGFRLAKDAK